MTKILTFLILIVVSIIIELIDSLPWWSFVFPIFLLGLLLPLQRWKISAFFMGFISGFFVWTLATFYFEVVYSGEMISSAGKMMKIPYLLLYIIIGLIGGSLSGLAFYSGFLLKRGREILQLEMQEI